MVNVVLDSDFLSSFLKIEALHLVREYFRVEKLLVPPAVLREIAVTSLLPKVVGRTDIEIREVVEGAAPGGIGEGEFSPGLGAGEREAIALTLQLDDSVLLMNDRLAIRSAERAGASVVNVPAFLLLYRSTGPEAAAKVRDLVLALENEDHYGFTNAIRDRLMG